jgi:hypothetical protein
MADPLIRFMMTNRGSGSAFTREDSEALDFYGIEAWSQATDAEVARSAWAPGAERRRPQMPPEHDPDRFLTEEEMYDVEIFQGVMSNRPLGDPEYVAGRRSGKE